MRYAKKVLGQRQQYNIKEHSTFEDQRKEVKKLKKEEEKLLKKVDNKNEKPRKVRKKGGFEEALKKLMKSTEPERKRTKSKSKDKTKTESRSKADVQVTCILSEFF